MQPFESRDSAPAVSAVEWLVLGAALLLVVYSAMPHTERLHRVHDQKKARADVLAIAYAIDEYARDHLGQYPRDLELLIHPDDLATRPPYLDCEGVPLDPWGRPYGYEPPSPSSTRPRVFTLGADGAPGGEGDDRDIDNQLIQDGKI